MEKISFTAEFVEAVEEEFSEDFKVVGIYFGEGDPAQGGQHWNFTQSISDDEDDGVCTTKEIQQFTVFGGIIEFTINSKHLTCKYDEKTSAETNVESLEIQFSLAPEKWSELSNMAKKVFVGTDYFNINEEYIT